MNSSVDRLLSAIAETFFEPHIWERGEEYVGRGMVLDCAAQDTSARFVVRGSGAKQYNVRIDYSIEHGQLQATCTCPYPDYCKHIVAAIKFGFYTDMFVPMPPARRQKNRVRHPVLDLLQDDTPVPGHESQHNQHNQRDDGKRYTPCLLLGSPGSGFTYAAGRSIRWQLDLYGRYIRQDGAPGASYRWKPGMQLVPDSPTLRRILQAISNIHDRRLDVAAWLRWVFDQEDLLLIVPDGRNNHIPLQKSALIGIKIEFVEHDPYRPGKYRPRFTCLPVAGQSNSQQQLAVINAGPEYFVLDPENSILYDTAPLGASASCDKLYELLRIMGSSPIDYTRDDITELARQIAGDPLLSAVLEVLSPLDEADLPCAEPHFRLYLNAGWQVQISPMVSYSGEELLSGTLRRIWQEEAADGTAHWVRPDYDREQAFDDRIDGLAPVVPYSAYTPHGPKYVSDSSPAEILQLILLEFAAEMERGELELMVNRTPVRMNTSIHIEVESGIDWLDIRATEQGETLDLREVDALWNLVVTRSGYRVVRPDEIAALRTLQDCSLREDEIRLHHLDIAAADPLLTLLNSARLGLLPDDLEPSDDSSAEQGAEPASSARIRPDTPEAVARMLRLRNQLEQALTDTNAPPAAGFHGNLRGYQHTGLAWLRFLKTATAGGILADDMGLGKTIQAIALLADYRAEGVSAPALVLAPVSTLGNWKHEFSRFLPDEPVVLHAGSDRGAVPTGAVTVLCSYQTMLRDRVEFSRQEFSLVILDEAQQFKNHRTKLHGAVARLRGQQRLLLSGTPIENGIMDLWSLMQIANPGLLMSQAAFKRRYAGSGAGSGAGSDGGAAAAAAAAAAGAAGAGSGGSGSDHVQQLQQRIRPYFLRRTKEMIAGELLPKEEIRITVSPGKLEADFYQRLETACRQTVQQLLKSPEPHKAGIAILQTLTRLRQAAIAPQLVGGPEQSAKLDALVAKLTEAAAEGHAILVFSQFVRVLELIQQRLDRAGLAYAYLDGSFTAARRTEQIESFRNNEHIQIFLLSLKAGGVGINLTEADYVCIVDPWWNPAVESQAIDRSHRIGQTKKVLAMRFIVENSIEERVCELQQRKRELIETIFGSDTSLFSSLDSSEILQLFGAPDKK